MVLPVCVKQQVGPRREERGPLVAEHFGGANAGGGKGVVDSRSNLWL